MCAHTHIQTTGNLKCYSNLHKPTRQQAGLEIKIQKASENVATDNTRTLGIWVADELFYGHLIKTVLHLGQSICGMGLIHSYVQRGLQWKTWAGGSKQQP